MASVRPFPDRPAAENAQRHRRACCASGWRHRRNRRQARRGSLPIRQAEMPRPQPASRADSWRNDPSSCRLTPRRAGSPLLARDFAVCGAYLRQRILFAHLGKPLARFTKMSSWHQRHSATRNLMTPSSFLLRFNLAPLLFPSVRGTGGVRMDNITKDPAYNAVDPNDFPAMLNPARYGERSTAFDKIISATHDHFWDPLDKKYIDFSQPFDMENEYLVNPRTNGDLKTAIGDKLDEGQKIKLEIGRA